MSAHLSVEWDSNPGQMVCAKGELNKLMFKKLFYLKSTITHKADILCYTYFYIVCLLLACWQIECWCVVLPQHSPLLVCLVRTASNFSSWEQSDSQPCLRWEVPQPLPHSLCNPNCVALFFSQPENEKMAIQKWVNWDGQRWHISVCFADVWEAEAREQRELEVQFTALWSLFLIILVFVLSLTLPLPYFLVNSKGEVTL